MWGFVRAIRKDYGDLGFGVTGHLDPYRMLLVTMDGHATAVLIAVPQRVPDGAGILSR